MARNVATLLLVFAYGSCMEMRETVERMVMVRTTGSDLQPAATGYIYKKESDGPASVVKMGESEVIEHFSKLYGKPKVYIAPVPAAGPFYDKAEEEERTALMNREKLVKPVVEHDGGDEYLDGIADEKYEEMFEQYAKQFGNPKHDFEDYLHGVGHFDHGIYHGLGKGYGSRGYVGYGDKGQHAHGIHHDFEKGAGWKNHGRYAITKGGDNSNAYVGADDHEKHYAGAHAYKREDHKIKGSLDNEETLGGFHKNFDKDQFKKDHDSHDGEKLKGEQDKFANNDGYESDDRGYEKGGSRHASQFKGESGKHVHVIDESQTGHDDGETSEESKESGHGQSDFGVKGERYDGKGYGYKIKH